MKFPDKNSKVLVLCQEGNVRSVGLAFRLKGHYDFKDILTSGVLRVSDETKCVLWDWADVIYVVGEPKLLVALGMFVKDKKVVHMNIGNDVWGNPYDPDLQRTLQRALEDTYEDAQEIYKGYL